MVDHAGPVSNEHSRAIPEAINAAYGTMQLDVITAVGGGASGAFPYVVQIGDRRSLVRIEGPASPLRNPHQYASMRIAAAAGIAPRLHHVDESARVAVMDFVEERPLASFPGGPSGLARAVGTMLRRLHATTPFPAFVEYP
ncbi:phosphotransferase, partial [Nostoc sp. NIES-2111]